MSKNYQTSLYSELMGEFTKEASFDSTEITKELENLSIDELERLAAEVGALANPADLVSLAQMMPSYQEAIGSDASYADPVHENAATSGLVDTSAYIPDPGLSVVAAEGDEEEEDEEEEKEEIKEEEKEEIKEEKKKEEDETPGAEPTEDDKEVSASETLYNILKEGAAIEEFIETRAYEMANEMVAELVKEAEAEKPKYTVGEKAGFIGWPGADNVKTVLKNELVGAGIAAPVGAAVGHLAYGKAGLGALIGAGVGSLGGAIKAQVPINIKHFKDISEAKEVGGTSAALKTWFNANPEYRKKYIEYLKQNKEAFDISDDDFVKIAGLTDDEIVSLAEYTEALVKEAGIKEMVTGVAGTVADKGKAVADAVKGSAKRIAFGKGVYSKARNMGYNIPKSVGYGLEDLTKADKAALATILAGGAGAGAYGANALINRNKEASEYEELLSKIAEMSDEEALEFADLISKEAAEEEKKEFMTAGKGARIGALALPALTTGITAARYATNPVVRDHIKSLAKLSPIGAAIGFGLGTAINSGIGAAAGAGVGAGVGAVQRHIHKDASEFTEEDILKLADMFSGARMLANDVAARMGKIGPAAHNFVEQFMEQVKTIAAKTGDLPDVVAHKLSSAMDTVRGNPVPFTAGAVGTGAVAGGAAYMLNKGASEDVDAILAYAADLEDAYADLEKSASEVYETVEDEYTANQYLEQIRLAAEEIEEEYEKLAVAGFEMIEQIGVQFGQKAGKVGADLYDFVKRFVENVKTISAKTGKPALQVAQEGAVEGAPGAGAVAGFEAVNPMTGQQMAPPSFMDRVQQSEANMAVEAREYIKDIIKQAAREINSEDYES